MTLLDQVRTEIGSRPSYPLALAAGFVALDIVTRLLPQSLNCTAVAATALLAGTLFESRLLAAVVPFAGMALSEPFLRSEDWRILAVVYAALCAPAAIGHWARQYRRTFVLLPLACAGSLLFFVASNFAVWTFTDLYAHGIRGLIACYVAALPFLRNTILGDLTWLAALLAGLSIGRHIGAIRPALALRRT